MVTKVQKWGNSLGLRIPRAFAAEANLMPGSPVNITVRHGELVVTPAREAPCNLDEMLAQVTPENTHGELATGRPHGGEAW